MGIRFGVITDVHYNEGTASELWGGVLSYLDTQYRQYSTAKDRLVSFLSDMEVEAVDFCVQLGDIIDAGSDERDSDISDAVYQYDTHYSGTTWNVLGNHESERWSGSGANTDLSDYWTAMDTAANSGTRANEWNPDGRGTAAYTFDYKQVRFVVLFAEGANNDLHSQDEVEELTWLSGTALDTTLPVVVLTHASLTPENATYPYGWVDNAAAVRTALEAAGNVQLVVNGHFHRNSIDDWTVPHQTINDILYLNLRGSVLGAGDGDSSDTATVADSAHYLIEIIPNAVLGDTNPRANVEVTGYYKGKNKEPNKYIIG
ncbi:MAG: hypothetical protein GY841_04550 [FCB group bacterium]|nr:hypothetical protein [FCB group bacterium]